MKKRVATGIILTILLLIIFTIRVHALEAFNISAFHIDMEVYEDNSYFITETIDVEFADKRHGIIRNIPLKTYKNKSAQISKINVQGHKFTTGKSSGNLDIKIGDPNKYASEAEQYVISYLYTIGDDGLKDMDELYWNLIGLQWDCEINNVTFSINMPKTFSEDRLNFTYGRKGSTQNEEVEWSIIGNTIDGKLMTSLGPNEALTVALPLPEGYYTLAKKIKAGGTLGVRAFIGLVPFIIGFAMWFVTGKKKQSFPTVEFYPPQGITSADAGFLIDGRVDPFDITSLIIYWADKGYLSISEYMTRKMFRTKKAFLIKKLRRPDQDARQYEHFMFQRMFYLGDGAQVSTEELKNQFYSIADSTKKQIKDSFEKNNETKIFQTSNTICRWTLRAMGILITLPFTYEIIKGASSSGEGSIFVSAVIFSLFIMITLYAVIFTLFSWKAIPRKGRLKKVLLGTIFTCISVGIYFYGAMNLENGLFAIISIVLVIILGILSTKCERRTELGIWYEEKLIGFREFLKATELDKIKMLVEENPQYFYNILPYAMVLGVTDRWAKNFDEIMIRPPEWYHSDGMYSDFSASRFAHDVEQSMYTVTDAMHVRPSSEDGGSSDGGSSGGGSGGGGGSSW